MKPMIWMWSDPHFWHGGSNGGIIAFSKRPYATIEDMNKDLIRRHNAIVGKDDLVICFGDFGMGPVERLKEIFDQLNGRQVLIRGNHDRGIISMLSMGFAMVVDECSMELDGNRYYMSHRPHSVLPKNCKGCFHGHVHLADPEALKRAVERRSDRLSNFPGEELIEIPPFNLNICAEVIGYAPISYRDAITRLDKQLAKASKKNQNKEEIFNNS